MRLRGAFTAMPQQRGVLMNDTDKTTVQLLAECTAALQRVSTRLQAEIAERRRAEEELRRRTAHFQTEHKRLEEQLLQARKMEAIGTLAGGIAHDFNNILAAIIGYTELAVYDLPQDSAPERNLQAVLSAGKRAKALVQQILAFSRRARHERGPVRLHLLVNEALTLLRASLPTTIEIQQQLDPQAGPILADTTEMHQVLLNLCANAEYAMRETGGILEVLVEPVEVDAAFAAAHPPLGPGPYVRLTVRDSGPGMDPEVLAHIFEPFFTTKAVGQGTGMGLAVVHRIVTNHGGTIVVQSTPGAGTTFALYLPQTDVTASGESHAQESIAPGAGRVLFVDDEEVLAHLGQAMLVRLGYDAVVSTSGLEALEVFRPTPQRFDVVITDQTMPHMTGEQLAKELRCIRPDIPIILCTGFSYVMSTEKAQALGIDRLLMKPLGMQELGVALQQVLSPRPAEARD
jgi:signal transduction histidine kinase/ActR/RegA family two-component response regulator